MKLLATVILIFITYGLVTYKSHTTPTIIIIQERDVSVTYDYDVPSTINSDLLWSIAYVESRYNKLAYNKSSGAVGIMQIIPKYHLKRCRLRSPNDLYNPSKAMTCAAKIMTDYLVLAKGNLREALRSYNAGPYRKNKSLGNSYADKVLRQYVGRRSL